ncbi:PQQ-dependent sugar dehydrogenase [Pseudonocardia sp.]|uniref:PQQ-dependent sugar dehydrogenase n=1 Tax=Pseudonocardia sp. TaxID=60912 RepID=UPI003D1124D4
MPLARCIAAATASALVALAGCAAPEPATGTGSGPAATPVPRTDTPGLRVTPVAAGFENPWDIGFLPDGRVLMTERPGRISLLSSTRPGATVTPVQADLDDVYARGEGGLMGLAVHPDFATSGRFTTCQTHAEAGRPTDVRLVTWQLDGTTARRVADPLVGGLPIAASGRHSGCRPTIDADGLLVVGTGDSARGALSQDLTSLGGKTLRLTLDGDPAPGNPFADAANPAQRLVYTYGHRNVQGVALRPGTGEVYTAEHGPSTDDEVNRLRPGGNYGWDPSQGGTVGGYDESVPMTDRERFPDAVPAVWSSGRPVEAVAGAAFLSGPQWGTLDGVLAVAALRGEKLLLMTLGPDGAVASVGVPAELDATYGRLRAVRSAPDGSLLVTTSNSSDDQVLRIDPE